MVWLGLAMILAGQGLRLWAVRELRRVGVVGWEFLFPGSYNPGGPWLTRGPFRLRHPCYIGSLLIIGGVGVCALGLGGLALVVPALPFFEDRVWREERLRGTRPWGG